MRKAFSLFAVLLVGCLAAIGWWRAADDHAVSRTEFMMGTYVEARAYGRQAAITLNLVFARLEEIEQKMATNRTDSEIAQVNALAGKRAVLVSADTFLVVERALEFAEITAGKYDPTILPIVELWRIGTPQARVPSQGEISGKLPLVNYQAVQLNEEQHSVFLRQQGMGLDLGSIAKGYAADEAMAIFRQHGVRDVFISLGGNVYTMGLNPQGERWRIGIQDPEGDHNAFIGVVETSNETLVTSGAYERYFEAGGCRYHHIIDPFTGYPAESDVLSSTIITSKSIDADALSTSVFILGREKGLQLIERLPGVDAVVIDVDHRVYVSSGMHGRFTLTDRSYHLMP